MASTKPDQVEFFRAATHQLKSPITVIQWCLQTALESEELKGHDREMVLKSVRQAENMGKLIVELSHFFRITNRAEPLALVRVDLGDLMEKVLAQCAVVAEKAGVRISPGPSETAVVVMADEMLLRQAAVNLVDNAIKYSPRGSTVEISRYVKKGRAVMTITDHGIGIAPVEQHQIFEEFYRGAQARAHAPEGSGLGLALARRIVEEFGGDISVESKVGKGSVFTLELAAA